MKFDFSKKEYDYFIENAGFTDQEIEIINFMRKGKTYKEIVGELYICERTIVSRVKSIKKKIMKCIKDA